MIKLPSKEEMKQKLDEHRFKLACGGAFVTGMVATYYYGKANGNVEVNLVSRDDADDWKKTRLEKGK